jgi:hypothetical protein
MTRIEDSDFARFVVPAVLTPSQYYDRVHRDDHETQAVKRLMLAVLSDAVRCFQAYTCARNRARRLTFAEAQAWILDRKAEGPFAFVTICEILRIEPNRMREGIRQFSLLQAGGTKPGRLGWRSPVKCTRPILAPIRPRHRQCRTLKGELRLHEQSQELAPDAHALDDPKECAISSEKRPPYNGNCRAR